MTRSDTPDAASRYLRALHRDVLALVRTGATPDELRVLADRLNTAEDLARRIEITRDEALAELAEDASLAAFAQVGPPPLLPPPNPHPVVLSGELMRVRRETDGALERIVAEQARWAQAQRGEGA